MLAEEEYYEAVSSFRLGTKVMSFARMKIFEDFMMICQPRKEDLVVDVGVSDYVTEGSNMFETLYPYKEKIVAVGLGPGHNFKKAFPDIYYLRIGPNETLPFKDKSFDIAVSNAVLEHVGPKDRQRSFISELCRISKKAFITVPNRFFFVEHHTGLPFFAWNGYLFRFFCKVFRKRKWIRNQRLSLMDITLLRRLVPHDHDFQIGFTGIKFGRFSSNLYLLCRAKKHL